MGPQRLANGDVLIACKAGRAREKRLCFLLGRGLVPWGRMPSVRRNLEETATAREPWPVREGGGRNPWLPFSLLAASACFSSLSVPSGRPFRPG